MAPLHFKSCQNISCNASFENLTPNGQVKRVLCEQRKDCFFKNKLVSRSVVFSKENDCGAYFACSKKKKSHY